MTEQPTNLQLAKEFWGCPEHIKLVTYIVHGVCTNWTQFTK